MAEVTDVPPAQPRSGPRVVNLFDYWATVYRRTWRGTVISSFITPLLYALAMGVLLGKFVTAGPTSLDGASSYLAFVAPGMVCAQTMTTVFGEVTWPVMDMVKWHRVYFSMVATPLEVSDIVLGQLGFVLFRVATVSVVFLLVLAPFGVYASVGGVIGAFLVQLLLGMGFAAPIFAFTSSLRSEDGLTLLFRIGMIPLFLFSGAFFPISNLGPALEWLARVTPLWQGVDLTRMLTVGGFDAGAAAYHVAYLLVFAVGGGWLAVQRLRKRLVT
ncbi:ABC transporter permease [Nocardioides terrisoli]|uniref:ABC transporter permease n=1 Tax=Nocardioides terrisoli TaxID=3388267 RepID=UPI00287BA573|nr:ABC transporter permease [Nocardioides marmorisolisilvae]